MANTLFDTVAHIQRSAELSDCGRYRWWLRRSWELPWSPHESGPPKSKGVCCFVMLNPSTADALQDDPTIRRCIAFARGWGYDTLSVRNLFPWRATDPKELVTAERTADIFGGGHGGRGESELLAACTANLLVAAWGSGVPFGRNESALKLWRHHFPGVAIYCLGTTKGGHPRHPLYVKGDTQPVLFSPAQPSDHQPGGKVMNPVVQCPNCGALMNEGESCPECPHYDSDDDCDCQWCDEQRSERIPAQPSDHQTGGE